MTESEKQREIMGLAISRKAKDQKESPYDCSPKYEIFTLNENTTKSFF